MTADNLAFNLLQVFVIKSWRAKQSNVTEEHQLDWFFVSALNWINKRKGDNSEAKFAPLFRLYIKLAVKLAENTQTWKNLESFKKTEEIQDFWTEIMEGLKLNCHIDDEKYLSPDRSIIENYEFWRLKKATKYALELYPQASS